MRYRHNKKRAGSTSCSYISKRHKCRQKEIECPHPTLRLVKNTRYGCGGRTRTYGLRVMRQSQAQIGVISAPICACCRHSLGGFSVVSVQPCPLFSDSGSKVGQTRCARTHSNSVSSSIAPEATARPTSTTSSFVQSNRIPLTSRAELIYD